MYGNLAGLGLKHLALYADNIADVPFLKRLIFLCAHIVAAEIALQFAVAVEDMTKARLAHNSLGYESARNADGLTLETVVIAVDLRGGSSPVKGRNLKRIFSVFAKLP